MEASAAALPLYKGTRAANRVLLSKLVTVDLVVLAAAPVATVALPTRVSVVAVLVYR